MRVLLVGGGGREHALAWKLAQSSNVDELYAAPGNPGIARHAECVEISASEISSLVRLAKDIKAELVVVGPESPLIGGLADLLRVEKIPVFGPSSGAARLEGSKAYAKDVMSRYGIPTAEFQTFTDPTLAADYARRQSAEGWKLVVKASGEALGKGAIVTDAAQDALEAIHMLMVERSLGDAGATVVIERRLVGYEASLMAFTDGSAVSMMPAVQDHKRILDGDRGPNTGGMGAFCPVARITGAAMREVEERVVQRTVAAMNQEGCPYSGVLYPGILFEADKPFSLEYNCRFGDPEAQCVLPLLQTDLVEIAMAIGDGRLGSLDIRWSGQACVSVVAASGGYPGAYRTGAIISGVEAAEQIAGVHVYHAGTREAGGHLLTSGGRVLTVSATADTVEAARTTAYRAAEKIQFEEMFYRRDIAGSAKSG